MVRPRPEFSRVRKEGSCGRGSIPELGPRDPEPRVERRFAPPVGPKRLLGSWRGRESRPCGLGPSAKISQPPIDHVFVRLARIVLEPAHQVPEAGPRADSAVSILVRVAVGGPSLGAGPGAVR